MKSTFSITGRFSLRSLTSRAMICIGFAALLFLNPALAAPTTVVGQLRYTVIRPAAVTGAVDNWTPGLLSDATSIMVATSGTTTLSGITGGADGRHIELCNSGPFAMTLANNATSTAANRFALAGASDWILGTTGNSCAQFVYSSTDARWKMTSKTGTTYPSLIVTTSATVGTTLGVTGASALTGGATVTAGLTTDSFNGGVIAPTITVTQHDWAPTGINTATIINVNNVNQANLTGIQAPTGSISGRLLCVENSGISTLSLIHQSAASVAANRFVLINGLTWQLVGSGSQSLCFYYDATASRWNQIGNNYLPKLSAGSSGQFSVATTGAVAAPTVALSGFANVQSATSSAFAIVNPITFTTATTNMTSYGVNSSIASTRTSGTGTLTNVAGYFNATSAQVNQALVADSGDVLLGNTSGTTTISNGGGAVTIGGNVAITGTKTLTVGGDVIVTTAKNKGTISLVAGTGTVTVNAGSICTCTDTTSVSIVSCAVSSTTLTATGLATDAISYLCF